MDINALIDTIGSLGFPIALCIFLFLHMQKESDNHKEEIHAMTETLNLNTIALNNLTTLIKERIPKYDTH